MIFEQILQFLQRHGQTDGQTDGRTDQRTDKTSYKDAIAASKKDLLHCKHLIADVFRRSQPY